MQTQQTQHQVSSFIKDRHPYRGKPFTSEVDVYQVTPAFGSRAVEKYAALLAVVGLSNEDRVKALKAVLDITRNQEGKAAAIDQGVVRRCTLLLSETDSEVKSNAARVIASLALHVQGREAISASRSLRDLAAFIRGDDFEVCEACALAVANMTSFRDGYEKLNSEDKRVKNLIDACLDKLHGREGAVFNDAGETVAQQDFDNATCARISLLVATSIAAVTQLTTGVSDALRAGAVPKLVTILKSGWYPSEPALSAKLCVRALTALWNLANSLSGKSEAIAEGAVQAIAAVLRQPWAQLRPPASSYLPKDPGPDADQPEGEEGKGKVRGSSSRRNCTLIELATEAEETAAEVRRTATGALMALAIDEQGKPTILQHAVEELSRLLTDPSPGTRRNAELAVTLAAESPMGPLLFTRAIVGDKDLLFRVFGEKSAKPLTALLLEDKAEEAASALATLTETEKGLHAVRQCLHIQGRLATLLLRADSQGNASLQKSCSVALVRICKGSGASSRSLIRELKLMLDGKAQAQLAQRYPELAEAAGL